MQCWHKNGEQTGDASKTKNHPSSCSVSIRWGRVGHQMAAEHAWLVGLIWHGSNGQLVVEFSGHERDICFAFMQRVSLTWLPEDNCISHSKNESKQATPETKPRCHPLGPEAGSLYLVMRGMEAAKSSCAAPASAPETLCTVLKILMP